MSEKDYESIVKEIDREIQKLRSMIEENIENGVPESEGINKIIRLQISQLEENKKLYIKASAMRELGKTEQEIKKMIYDYKKRKARIINVENAKTQRKEIIRKQKKR